MLRFRNALTFIKNYYPFSFSFGLADTREHCVESAQRVYGRLLLERGPHNPLNFETIALLAQRKDGTLDSDQVKDLIRLFRPDRAGNLSVSESDIKMCWLVCSTKSNAFP